MVVDHSFQVVVNGSHVEVETNRSRSLLEVAFGATIDGRLTVVLLAWEVEEEACFRTVGNAWLAEQGLAPAQRTRLVADCYASEVSSARY